METHFTFNESQYSEFKAFLNELKKTNWGTWNSRKFITFPGLPGYSVNQYEQTNGQIFVVVKFDRPVITPYDVTGKKFKVGGGRNYQPICSYF
jgi:hypothetical protein